MLKKKIKNPFSLKGFVSKAYFCDREEEINVLREHFENDRNVVLFSWRRMGKTMLVRYFMSLMEEEKRAETLYVDLMPTKDIEAAIRQIAIAVHEKFGKTTSGFSESFQKLLGKIGLDVSFDQHSGMPVFSIGIKNNENYQNSLNAIGEFLVGKEKKILVVLDEFQQIADYEGLNGEAVFRSWMQSFPTLHFIYSGSHRTLMSSMFSEKNRPFYRSAQLIQLIPIDFTIYRKFIQRHFKQHGKTISNEIIQQIYNWSRGQTYCIQLICNRLFASYDNIEQDDLNEILEHILEDERFLYSYYTNMLTNTQWKVLKAIAKEEPLEQPTGKDFIQKYNLGAASTVNTAMKMLMKNEIVIREGHQYLIHDILMARWLQKL